MPISLLPHNLHSNRLSGLPLGRLQPKLALSARSVLLVASVLGKRVEAYERRRSREPNMFILSLPTWLVLSQLGPNQSQII